MVFGRRVGRVKKPAEENAMPTTADGNDDEDPTVVEDAGPAQPASELIGADSSALSLDGRSLIVPEDGGDEDMSSLGTSRYGHNYPAGSAIGYVGNMRIVGRAEDYDNEEDPPLPPHRSPMHAGSPAYYGQQGDYDFQTNDYSVRTEEKEQQFDPVEKKEEHEDEIKKRAVCLPAWILEAPYWLKLVIISSLALLIAAIILIVVGARLASSNRESSSNQDQASPGTGAPFGFETESPIDKATEVPVAPPTALPVQSTSVPLIPPSIAPFDSTVVPTEDSTNEVTLEDTSVGTDEVASTEQPGNIATTVPISAQINFFVMGGRFDGEEVSTLTDELQSLPNMDGNTIMFHLGDWNSPYATSCVESSYTLNVEVYQQSSIPVYFVPGDNEFNDCPNPTQAFSYWYEYIMDFETRYWPSPFWNITRQSPDNLENFAFMQGNVLFVGINLVGGIVHDQNEWNDRHAANLEWINSTAWMNDGLFDTMIILAHADPDIEINDNFFVPFYTMVQTYDEKVIFMHRNLGIETWALEEEYNGISNLDVVVVEGSIWPPMWVQIDTATGNYSIDQTSWYQNYVDTGSMAPSP